MSEGKTAQSPILEVRDLTKYYGKELAVDHISFSIQRGEIVGLLGPNGAGKTTTIAMLLGLLEPSEGEIFSFGEPFWPNRAVHLARMNFFASYSLLPGNLKVWENLLFFGMLYGVRNLKTRIQEVTQLFEAAHLLRGAKTGFLSSGEQTRVGLAKSLLNEPELLLLDEPTDSLDPSISAKVRSIFRDYARDRNAAILWTSHDMYEIEGVCDRALFLSHGRILLEGNPRALPGEYGVRNLEELFIKVAREELIMEKRR